MARLDFKRDQLNRLREAGWKDAYVGRLRHELLRVRELSRPQEVPNALVRQRADAYESRVDSLLRLLERQPHAEQAQAAWRALGDEVRRRHQPQPGDDADAFRAVERPLRNFKAALSSLRADLRRGKGRPPSRVHAVVQLLWDTLYSELERLRAVGGATPEDEALFTSALPGTAFGEAVTLSLEAAGSGDDSDRPLRLFHEQRVATRQKKSTKKND